MEFKKEVVFGSAVLAAVYFAMNIGSCQQLNMLCIGVVGAITAIIFLVALVVLRGFVKVATGK